MSVRKAPAEGLSVRQRLALFHGSGINAESALTTSEEDITFDLMMKSGVKALNIQAAGIRPMQLKKYGVTQAAHMRRLDYDALHLVDPIICNEANAAFGAADVIASFLNSPQDAVALAGSEATTILNVSTEQLLEVCAGAPTEAIAVLKQSNDEMPLRGVEVKVLLDTGIRAPQLKQLGYNLASVREMSGITTVDIGKLGFTL